jgi:hypothetical protein
MLIQYSFYQGEFSYSIIALPRYPKAYFPTFLEEQR